MRRRRKAKIVATLGPASSTKEVIRELFDTGVATYSTGTTTAVKQLKH